DRLQPGHRTGHEPNSILPGEPQPRAHKSKVSDSRRDDFYDFLRHRLGDTLSAKNAPNARGPPHPIPGARIRRDAIHADEQVPWEERFEHGGRPHPGTAHDLEQWKEPSDPPRG